jgi:YD repeat-containing protein
VRPGLRWTYALSSVAIMLFCLMTVLPRAAMAGEAAPVQVGTYKWEITDRNGDRMIMASFPLPPPSVKMEAVNNPQVDVFGAAATLSDVPAFYWTYGCSATSAAMVFGYYDRTGYSNMYTGAANGGVCPLDNSVWGRTVYPKVTCGESPLAATHNGIDGRATKGHVDDYWLDYGSEVDPYAGNWTEHPTGTCTADYMGTNQWKYGTPVMYNSDGGTIFFMNTTGDPTYDYKVEEPTYRDGGHGMKLFAESRGYTVTTVFNQRIQGQGTNPSKGFTFANFQAEIDAGRPVLIHLTGHTMVGYGYNTAGSLIYVHDTWDYSAHTMTWGGMYSGMQHESVTVIRLQPSVSMEPIVEPQGHYYNTAPVLSNLGFDDTVGLNDGWYQMDSYSGSWTALFTNASGTSWDSDNWTIPGFAALGQGSHTVYFKASNDAGAVKGDSGEWSWQLYKDTVAPSVPVILAGSPDKQVWSSDNTVAVSWTAATDATSGVDGYSVLWDTSPSTDPAATKNADNATTVTSPQLADGNSHYFHIRAVDRAQNWGSTGHYGPFLIDTVAPGGPTGLNSTSHALSTWSNDNTVDIGWTGASDTTAGIDGYSVLWDTSPSTSPAAVKNTDNVTTVTSAPLADGSNHYFHIRAVDRAQNWGTPRHYGPFWIDTASPGTPTIASTNPAVNTWSNSSTVSVVWNAPADPLSGLDGYSLEWSTSAVTVPDQTKDVTGSVTSAVSPALSDGIQNYFHIRPVDRAGNWGGTLHAGPFKIDSVPPSGISGLASTSHVVGVWTNSNAISIGWTAAVDATSGAAGYSVVWNTTPGGNAPTVMNAGNVTSLTGPVLSDSDSIYVHIRAVDVAGNWAATTQQAGPFKVETVAPQGPTSIASTSHQVGAWSNNNTVTVTWTPAGDAASGVAGYSTWWGALASPDPNANLDADKLTSSASTTLPDGAFAYFHIRARDAAGNWGTVVTSGPYMISAGSPVLSGGGVSPPSGYQNTTFSFSVDYSHPLGLAPGSVLVSIDGGTPATMTATPGQSGNFTVAHTFSCNVTSLSVGNHSFVFSASDNASPPGTSVGDLGVHYGPSVQSIPPPAPSGGSGGGGGGGGGGGALPGYISLGPYINDSGLFNLAGTIRQDPLNVWLVIEKGITGKTASGTRLTQIGIFAVTESPPAAPGDGILIGPVYELLPEGATFSPAASLWIRFDPASLPAGIRASDIKVARWDGNAWTLLDTTVNASDATATTPVAGLGRYTLIAKPAPPPPTIPPQPAPEPARFILSDVKGGPARLPVDELYTVSGNVSNVGGSRGAYDLLLRLDGAVKETKQVFLDPGASTTVTFSFPLQHPRTYGVELNGNALSVTAEDLVVVRQPELSTTPPATAELVSRPVNTGIILAAGGGLALIAAMLVLVIRRFRR